MLSSCKTDGLAHVWYLSFKILKKCLRVSSYTHAHTSPTGINSSLLFIYTLRHFVNQLSTPCQLTFHTFTQYCSYCILIDLLWYWVFFAKLFTYSHSYSHVKRVIHMYSTSVAMFDRFMNKCSLIVKDKFLLILSTIHQHFITISPTFKNLCLYIM